MNSPRNIASVFVKYTLLLQSHLRLDLPGGLCTTDFPNKTMYATQVDRSLLTKWQSVKSAFNINLNPVDKEKFNFLSTFFYKEVGWRGCKN
jgi:hypothetical protein